ncbi:hypothetical protein Tco_0536609 [Tanacetum coccineum]
MHTRRRKYGFSNNKGMAIGGFFAWLKNQVVLDEEVTPPTMIQKISDYKSTPKLQSKRKNYVSRETIFETDRDDTKSSVQICFHLNRGGSGLERFPKLKYYKLQLSATKAEYIA